MTTRVIGTFSPPHETVGFHVDVEPSADVDGAMFTVHNGETDSIDDLVIDKTALYRDGKFYLELHPHDAVSMDMQIDYAVDDADSSDQQQTTVFDKEVTVHPSDVLWMDLRPRNSRVGIDQ